ncbi:MAG: Hsp20/alpha crystallin family protein [Chitinophagaceae bacterium]
MKTNLAEAKEYSAYPGEYSPMPEAEVLLKELKLATNDRGATPLVNMREYKDSFRIDVIIPGVRREDIFIHVQDSILTIMVLHMACEKLKKELQIHEFDTRCLERHILLPENADAEFVSAEYKQGILSLQIPKAKEPPVFKSQQIVVY